MTTREVVGREEELGGAPRPSRPCRRQGPRALILAGDAGIGKSTLWQAGLDHARAAGLRVLTSRPAEAERDLGARRSGGSARRGRRRGAADAVDAAATGARGRTADRGVGGSRRSAHARGRSARRAPALAANAADSVSPSTTSSGSTRPRHARSRSRCGGWRRPDSSFCWRGVRRARRSRSSRRPRLGPGPSCCRRAAQRRSDAICFCTTARPAVPAPDAAPSPRHRRAGIRSSRSSWLASALRQWTSDPLEPLPIPETLEQLVSARLARPRDATREALLLTAAHGRPSTLLLTRGDRCDCSRAGRRGTRDRACERD